jgi:hypothetical protein
MCNVHHALAERERILNAVGDAGAGVGSDNNPVEYYFDRMLAPAIDGRSFFK